MRRCEKLLHTCVRLGILKGKKHVVLVVVAFMIIALVILHAFAANSIYKAAGFSLTIRFVI
jgi:hypothetical protein